MTYKWSTRFKTHRRDYIYHSNKEQYPCRESELGIGTVFDA